MNRARLLAILLIPFATRALAAAPIKVDIAPALGRSDTATPGWHEWSVEDGDVATRTLDGVTVTLRATGSGRALGGFWHKPGLARGATMTTDGVRTEGPGENGALELVLAGLAPGRHTLVTYHDTARDGGAAGLEVAVDGRPAGMVTPSSGALDEADAARAYVELDAVAGRDVVVRFTPDGSSKLAAALLNGFEIDAADPRRRALRPSPAHLEEHADGDDGAVELAWRQVEGAARYHVFLASAATADDALALAGAAALESAQHLGTVEAPRFEAPIVRNDSVRHYAWRVDTVGADGEVTRGDAWRFRVRHLAFPGAEGWGRFARGGRGGRVIKVTSLADSGPGSLRAAVEAEGPRTVVFEVSGLITLESKLVFRNPYLTVAGQTAPGKGICIRDWTFGGLGARDTIIRFVRVRLGNRAGKTMDGMGLASCDHCIVDHCSVSWTIDEAFSTRGARNITVQRTLISEALNEAGHKKYPPGTRHGYAASIGGDIGSFHHNLLAHCAGRNWSLAGGLDKAGRHTGRLDLRNNVVYNWGHRTTDGGAMEVQFVGNYYKPGPASRVFHVLKPERNHHFGPQDYYVLGNVMEGRYDASEPLAGVVAPRDEPHEKFIVAAPFFEPHVTTQTAREAYDDVLADVGCTMPALDEHDRRVIAETRAGTTKYKGSRSGLPGLIDSQDDVGGWEDYPEVRRPADWDTDGDGMPNAWETRRGLDASDAADGRADPDGDGFTNLEDYLAWLAAGERVGE